MNYWIFRRLTHLSLWLYDRWSGEIQYYGYRLARYYTIEEKNIENPKIMAYSRVPVGERLVRELPNGWH